MAKNVNKEKFHKLVRQMAQGKKRALEEFYLEYGKFLYAVALSFCKDKYLADEAVDDVLVKIWALASTYLNVEYPKSWMYKLAKNAAINKLRQTPKTVELTENLPKRQSELDQAIDKISFMNYISALDAEEQEILTERFIANATFAEVAKGLGVPVSTVTSKYYRALEKIREKFFKD